MSLCHQFLTYSLPLTALLCGCSDDGFGTLYPVHGAVVMDNEPIRISTGYVILMPDTKKGNNTEFKPSGTIGADGNYVVYTMTRSGAPPGWYKVIVTGSGPSVRPTSGESKTRPVSTQIVPEQFGQETTTSLSIEVVARPNAHAYDLNVTN